MGLDAMRIRVEIKRFLVISIRTCYKSVCKHPFLVGFVCFLIFLYKSFPFLFSLLVSASPILVCTAILLGTLLSFGKPNIPEIEKEKEEEVADEVSSLKTGIIGDATVVVEKDESYFVESFVGKRKETSEEAIGEDSWEKNGVSKIEGEDGLGGYLPLVDENTLEIQFEKQVIEAEREFDDLKLEKKREIHEERQQMNDVLTEGKAAESLYSLISNGGNENLQVEDDKSPGGFIEAEHDDHLNLQHLSWKRANDNDEEEDEDEEEEGSDSGSDGAESSSPDASMADIIPMLDELHPLLHEGDPQPAHISDDGSDAASEGSHKSSESSVESDEDIENQADGEEDGDDDNDNEEEDEEARGGKEDESKSAIKWTEDDQKNLMDLGTSEIERNLRLENLIARRRARKSMRLMAEKNLIDLDGADLPLNIPPISTTRRNPFDLPYDSFDDVPGSAPSILLPRHNPFDIPYDSNEEKPDLKGDSFQQEFSAFHHKEPFFRRHESFNVGSSILGAVKQERQDLRWKPYFVPERFATEETSYRAFQRQLSEASESKLSSVPDTESVSSAVEEEDKKLNEEDDFIETEMISSVEHASVLVQRGSLSSEDVDPLDIGNIEERDAHHDEDEITLGDVENHNELDSSLSTLGGTSPVELNTREILLRMEPGDEEYSSRSSLSSLSEVDEKISDVKGSPIPEQSYGQTEDSHVSTQASLDTDFHFLSEVADENGHRVLVLEPRGNPTGESTMQTSFESDFHFTSCVEESNRCIERVSEPTDGHIGDSSILLQASIDSDSHSSEVVDNVEHKEPVLETRGSLISESGIITQTSVELDFHFTGVAMDDNQHKEPVYDSSPQAVDKLPSFLSISSDTQGEVSETNSPPMLAEFVGKESEVHTESIEKDASDYKESHEGSSQKCSLEENESRVAESEHDVKEVRLAGDDLTFNSQNGQNGFMKRESAVEHEAVDSPPSSSDGSVKEGLVHNQKGFNNKLDQLESSSLNAETTLVPHQDEIEKLDSSSSSDCVASAETILDALEEQHPPVAVEVSANSKLSSSESESQIPSSVDAQIRVNNCQATVEKLDLVVSGTRVMPSDDLKLVNEERQPAVIAEQVLQANPDTSSSEIKDVEELSFRKVENPMQSSSSDAIIAADLLEDADVKLVSSGSSYEHVSSEAKSSFELEKQLSWSDKAIVGQSLTDHDVFEGPSIIPAESTAEVKIENNVDVPEVFYHETSESASVPQQSLEYESKADEVDFIDNILDKIVYEDSRLILKGPDYSAEAHRSSVVEENINQDEDEIKEIDEGLLSELDTVGDFRVKEVVGESLHNQQIQNYDYSLLSTDSSAAEIKPELPVLEVRSVIDIDLAFKQLHEGVDVEEVILPSMVEDQPVDDEYRVPEETNSYLPATEASSLEDIHVAIKQYSKGNSEEMSKQSDLKEGSAKVNEAGSSSSMRELPVLEIRTTNDIDLAFKQLSEGVDVEEVILPSTIEQNVVENEPRDTHRSYFNLPIVEARSLEDLYISMKQASEENIEERSKPSDLNEGASKVCEVDSSCSTKELPVLEVRTADDIDLAFKQLSEGVDVEEVILPSTLEQHIGVNESRDSQQSSSDLQVLEARCLEELHIAMTQVSQGNIEGPPQSSDPTKETVSRALEVNKMGLAKDTVSSAEVGFIQTSGRSTKGTSAEAPHSPNDGFDETSGVSSLSMADTEGEKAMKKSDRLSSSSSSSSSSSGSD
ncbi:uncharacterized protein LOC8268592 [Ricinus communis]|uniref:uncharacterized protein LOC8268592 n=1 Tax=Ricinus communis TaxID=3988 RepID=UPI00201AC539|nr:uncharacterized protein LOC8268592 [Ricinus communis]XP_015581963.2 uncharacterized protein LOC8268592 [Ricinus communis]XP_015581964.2 uncharacterized protein LOC8268592 [Ricinus communis]